MPVTVDITRIGAAVGCFFAGTAFGYLLYRLASARIRRSLQQWGGSELTIAAVRDLTIGWFAIVGLYGAVALMPLSTHGRHAVGRLLLALVILSATVVGARITTDAIKLYALRGGVAQQSSILVTVARLVVAIVGGLILLQMLGVSITPILTALGVGGLAVALALQDTLSNFFAGVHLLASKKIRLGDYVALDSGQEGYVEDINWRNTSVRQLPNNMIIIPNAKMASAIVTNFHRPEHELAVQVNVGVDYLSNLEEVETLTLDVARGIQRTVEGCVPTFEPLVRFNTFDDASIRFTTVLRAREFADQYVIKHEFVKRLHARFEDEGVRAFPTQRIVVGTEEAEFGSLTAR